MIDDLLDYTQDAAELGKPGLQDLALGLSTAPVLYASEEFPDCLLYTSDAADE